MQPSDRLTSPLPFIQHNYHVLEKQIMFISVKAYFEDGTWKYHYSLTCALRTLKSVHWKLLNQVLTYVLYAPHLCICRMEFHFMHTYICLLNQLSNPFQASHVSPATCIKISLSGYSPSSGVFFFIELGLFIPKQYTGMEKWVFVVLIWSEWQSQSRKCVNGERSKRRITRFVSCGCITNIYFTPDF